MKHSISSQYPQKRAFITGAGSGLGKAFAEELAQDGWILGICDINAETLAESAKELVKLGAKVFEFQLDVANKVQYAEVAHSFLEKTGGIDVLFNNAGVGDGGIFEEYSLENWEWMVGINQMSVVYGCHLFIPIMKKQQSGCIISTASAAAISAAPQMGAYNMTKAAVVAISETLYVELMSDNIHVSVVQPWFFRTNIIQFARGGELIKKISEKMMQKSNISAQQVAQEILIRTAKKELYIILPEEARKMWKLKRLAPTWFRKQIQKKWQQAIQKR